MRNPLEEVYKQNVKRFRTLLDSAKIRTSKRIPGAVSSSALVRSGRLSIWHAPRDLLKFGGF